MDKNKNDSKFDEGVGLIYAGFVILGGAAAGTGLALICHGVMALLRK